MSTREIPLLFTPDNRTLVRQRLKTETRRDNDKLSNPLLPGYPVLTPDNDWIIWSNPTTEEETAKCYPKGTNAGFRSPYGCPQREPVRYWMKEPVEIMRMDGLVAAKDVAEGFTANALIKYLDTNETAWRLITESDEDKILARKDWRKPSTAMFMLKSFTRTWLPGVRVWPERLGEMSEESALAEGIEYYDPGDGSGYYEFKPLNVWGERHKECYAAIWNSINGPGSWQPDKWTWAIKFEPSMEEDSQ